MPVIGMVAHDLRHMHLPFRKRNWPVSKQTHYLRRTYYFEFLTVVLNAITLRLRLPSANL